MCLNETMEHGDAFERASQRCLGSGKFDDHFHRWVTKVDEQNQIILKLIADLAINQFYPSVEYLLQQLQQLIMGNGHSPKSRSVVHFVKPGCHKCRCLARQPAAPKPSSSWAGVRSPRSPLALRRLVLARARIPHGAEHD